MVANSAVGAPVRSAGNFAELMGAASNVPGAMDALMQQFAKQRVPGQFQKINPPMYRPGGSRRATQGV